MINNWKFNSELMDYKEQKRFYSADFGEIFLELAEIMRERAEFLAETPEMQAKMYDILYRTESLGKDLIYMSEELL